jgi:hypothetical protein
MKDIKRANFVLGRVRIVIYSVLALGVAYGLWRFDVGSLPTEGCSPLYDIQPGDRLLIDRRPGTLREGDAVMFRDPAGELLLGRVGTPPASAPREIWEACAAGALWIVKEQRDCPGGESAVLGPIARDAVAGRVVGLPW